MSNISVSKMKRVVQCLKGRGWNVPNFYQGICKYSQNKV